VYTLEDVVGVVYTLEDVVGVVYTLEDVVGVVYTLEDVVGVVYTLEDVVGVVYTLDVVVVCVVKVQHSGCLVKLGPSHHLFWSSCASPFTMGEANVATALVATSKRLNLTMVDCFQSLGVYFFS